MVVVRRGVIKPVTPPPPLPHYISEIVNGKKFFTILIHFLANTSRTLTKIGWKSSLQNDTWLKYIYCPREP